LAATLLRAELPDEAIAELVLLRDGLHDGSRFYGMLGDARLMAGDVQGAVEEYEAAESASPDSGRAVFHLARLYESTGFINEAIDYYQRSRVHKQWRQESGWRAAALLAGNGAVDQAEALLRVVLAENADNRSALMGLGRLLAIADRYAAALPYFERLQVLDPDDYRTYFFLSKLYFRLQREAEAEKAFNSYQLGKRRAEMKESVEEDLEGVLRQFGEWTQ
jgi:tetratricopeptide (TPR) repeat protein